MSDSHVRLTFIHRLQELDSTSFLIQRISTCRPWSVAVRRLFLVPHTLFPLRFTNTHTHTHTHKHSDWNFQQNTEHFGYKEEEQLEQCQHCASLYTAKSFARNSRWAGQENRRLLWNLQVEVPYLQHSPHESHSAPTELTLLSSNVKSSDFLRNTGMQWIMKTHGVASLNAVIWT
jgi:hypothetical protein